MRLIAFPNADGQQAGRLIIDKSPLPQSAVVKILTAEGLADYIGYLTDDKTLGTGCVATIENGEVVPGSVVGVEPTDPLYLYFHMTLENPAHDPQQEPPGMLNDNSDIMEISGVLSTSPTEPGTGIPGYTDDWRVSIFEYRPQDGTFGRERDLVKVDMLDGVVSAKSFKTNMDAGTLGLDSRTFDKLPHPSTGQPVEVKTVVGGVVGVPHWKVYREIV
jgi:hypothetical protein